MLDIGIVSQPHRDMLEVCRKYMGDIRKFFDET